MILNRLGNKSRIAEEIIKFFPPHETYVEPFFGAGGLFFNKPKAKFNILNDNDADVFNLFQVFTTRQKEFLALFEIMPTCENLWNYWRTNQEDDPVRKAVRFVFLSNYGYMGKSNTLQVVHHNKKQQLLNCVDKTNKMLENAVFLNVCYSELFAKLPKRVELGSMFVYADPPYLSTQNNYQSSFKENDYKALLETLINQDVRFAVSEFDNLVVTDIARSHGLNVHYVTQRQNLKNVRTEILITNYIANYKLF